MDASINEPWKRAFIFDASLAESIEVALGKFRRDVIDSACAEIGLLSSQIHTKADVESHFSETARTELPEGYFAALIKIEAVETVTWSAYLGGNTFVHSVSKNDILSLPNSGNDRVFKVVCQFGRLLSKVNVEINSKSYSDPATISANGDLRQITSLKDDLLRCLDAAKQHWWVLRSGALGWFIAGALATLYIVALAVSLTFGLNAQPNGRSETLGMLVAIIGFSAFIALSIFWNWLFPRVEFQFGTGKRIAELKSKIRIALLSFVTLSVIAQQLLHHLT